jgi:hypothetical protein
MELFREIPIYKPTNKNGFSLKYLISSFFLINIMLNISKQNPYKLTTVKYYCYLGGGE